MLLSDREIRERKLIDIPTEKNFRATSYDLSVGKIITVEGKEVEDLVLRPSGVVQVISSERITLPPDITSLAMVKTDLCNKGILALNIGIAGPGYSGHLSSPLLNFSKTDFYLTKDEVFLRLVFQECYISPRQRSSDPLSDQDYIATRKKQAVNFSDKFLNVEAIATEAGNKTFGDFKREAFKMVPLLIGGLAVLTFLLTFGANYANRAIWSSDDIRKENIKADLLREIGAARESGLESKMLDLERRIQKLNLEQEQRAYEAAKNKKP
ncbi:MAG: dCTP deaminase domain-containing protein [Pyrinomonadaceae bacterium]